MSERLLILLVLGLGTVVCGVQLALAWMAVQAEKREGLKPSSLRLLVVGVCSLAAFGLLIGTWVSTQPRQPAAALTGKAGDPAVIAQKKAELEALDKKAQALRDELAVLDPQAAPAEPEAPPPLWPAVVMLLLVGGATFAGFFLGGRGLGKRRQADSSESDDKLTPAQLSVNALALLGREVEGARYADALTAAQKVHPESLETVELIDFLYLRAFAATGAALGLAPVGDKTQPVKHEERSARLAEAAVDLDRLVELAPNMPEARYLRARVDAARGRFEEALAGYRAAAPQLGSLARELPLANDESVCLLAMAQAKLGAADSAAASALFDEVTRLGVLGAQIPVALTTHRLLQVAGHLAAGRLDEARAGVAAVRKVEGLDEQQRRTTQVTCDVYELLIAHKAGDRAATQEGIRQFLERWLPEGGLPPVDEQAADEFLFPAVDPATLMLPADVYRGFYFVLAVTRAEEARTRGRLADGPELERVTEPLLRALQFSPRHRDALAALGYAVYMFSPPRRDKAMEWLEAAVALGVRSRQVQDLMERLRRARRARAELLDVFHDASARFLADAMVDPRVRRALVEELGRFQDFKPVLLELDATGTELDTARPATINGLVDRARFVMDVAMGVMERRGPGAPQLVQVASELRGAVEGLEAHATRVQELEHRAMAAVGKVVLK